MHYVFGLANKMETLAILAKAHDRILAETHKSRERTAIAQLNRVIHYVQAKSYKEFMYADEKTNARPRISRYKRT